MGSNFLGQNAVGGFPGCLVVELCAICGVGCILVVPGSSGR